MSELVSPRQAARAIGVSESSLKRWCDQGLLPFVRTPGGHRKLSVASVVEYLRQTSTELVAPEAIGLPPLRGDGAALENAAQRLAAYLLSGDDRACRAMVIELFTAGQTVSAICDRVWAGAMHEIGLRWDCGDAEIYQERRACEISLRVLHELCKLVPPVPRDAPLAMGGTAAGDPYQLASTMVELVLREHGWNAVALGSSLPLATMAAAIERNRPRLFWLSVSHIEDHEQFLAEYNEFFQRVQRQTAVVVGGRSLTPALREQMNYAAFCDQLSHLETFAAALRAAPAQRL